MRNDAEISLAISSKRMDFCLLNLRWALIKQSIAAKEYNPRQPRVPAGTTNGGRWTNDDAGISLDQKPVKNSSLPPLFALAASIEECDEQNLRDLIICRSARQPTFYAQAMVRLVACEKGHPIPPLNF